jgi:hypothetical protein
MTQGHRRTGVPGSKRGPARWPTHASPSEAWAFNECANVGFSVSVPVTWQSSGMLVSSSGHLTATISTNYGGPSVEADERRDVLFWAIEADYPEPPFGDFQSIFSTPVPEREGGVVEGYFAGRKLKELGTMVGVSESWASRVLARALIAIRRDWPSMKPQQ